MKLLPEELELLKPKLIGAGAVEEAPPSYAMFRLRLGEGIVIAYTTGSVVFAGKDAEGAKRTFLQLLFETIKFKPRVGCDEAGKGEFVGPLVVACICAGERCIKAMLEAGVKDSKELSPKKVIQLAQKIKANCKGRVKVLMPEAYNRLYRRHRSVDRLLAVLYGEVLNGLAQKCGATKAIVDSFSHSAEKMLKGSVPEDIPLLVVPGGESDIAVAGASVVAKAERLKRLEQLSKLAGFPIGEGNANNRELLERIPAHLRHKFVKEHFKVS